MSCIYEGTHVYYHRRLLSFSTRWVFQCPVDECEYWMHATSEEGAFTLAVAHSVNAGHAVFLETLASERVDEGMVQLARSIAAKVGAA